MVSNARLDLPDPESPVMTISASRGRSRSTPFRLWARAPEMTMRSDRATDTSLRTRTGVPVGRCPRHQKQRHPKWANADVVPRSSQSVPGFREWIASTRPSRCHQCLLRSACDLRGEQCVDGGASAHRRFVYVLVGAVGYVHAAGAVGEGRDSDLRVPAGIEHAWAHP